MEVSRGEGNLVRVSEYFKINQQQASLEFVDVDVYGDTKLFVDPRSLKDIDSDWAHECVRLIQDFFDNVMHSIQSGDHGHARRLLADLHEPNETHLGLSKHQARGHAMGDGLARDIWQALLNSDAAKSGLLEDLEDTALFVEGVGFDIISDITTNIIRSQLIQFTQQVCRYYGIPLQSDISSGRLWERRTSSWRSEFVELPMTDHGPLILVPKSLVRSRHMSFDPGEYFNHWVLPSLQHYELGAGSALVEILKNGRKRVTKKAVKEKYGVSSDSEAKLPRTAKQLSLEATARDPSILDDYRAKKNRPMPGLDHGAIADATNTPPPDWDKLLDDVLTVKPGKENASKYHHAVEALLKALFWPALDFDSREYKIHEGRKRIDITFNNIAHGGFFDWVNRVVDAPAHQVYVECKNYDEEIANPEVDQLSGRFAKHRGRLGLLCFRSAKDKARVIKRCRDTALDDRGFIIALDDNDLAKLVDERKKNSDSISFDYLMMRYQELV